MSPARLLLISILSLTVGTALGGGVPPGGVLSNGPLPDLSAFTADGKPVQLRTLCKGKYTVLKAGCLTCPEFHRMYGGVEVAYADYAAKGVQFFYFYKSLRHPELNGFVQAQNMEERLLQLAEAKKKLGTRVPWIADTIDDSMRIGLQSGSDSIYLIDPGGRIIWASGKMDEAGLRAALARAVGPVANPTKVGDLHLPRIEKPARAVNEDTELGVARPDGLTILSITPAKPEDTYYVKLRAEADADLLTTGNGRLFLGFYPDPIHKAHWNNLTAPMKYTLTLPEGVTATPKEASAKKGPGDSDTLPRQFWVEVKGAHPGEEIQLRVDYFGCAPGMCLALSHDYTIRIESEDRGSATYGLNRGPKSSKTRSTAGGNRFAQMDSNNDGSLSLEELGAYEQERRGTVDKERTQRKFDKMDVNHDGTLSKDEVGNAPKGRGGRK